MPPLPSPLGLLQADAGWSCIDLLSDVHLHPDMPRTLAALHHHLQHTPADAVLILGDLFEVWLGDDARHDGFEAQALAVLRQASARRTLGFLPGNRDFLVGPALLADAGVLRLEDPTLLAAFGQRWLLTHGDALCVDDTDYQAFRQQVRSPHWQQQFLALPLDERRHQARLMREASQAHQAQLAATNPLDLAEVDAKAASAWLSEAGAPVMVHGHTHRPGQHALPGGGRRHVLGDWDLDGFPARAGILRLDARGLQAIDLALTPAR